ncbi:hypothetical protein Bca4012_093708 [Brassica carinata]|uniref:Uncharacterized protein n=1 Tax=Brassica carinata TaxID=52824 RepID=A0A8X7PU01_BRACI|nr:hypothetical protein Bca52824_075887 [Brassica carinata]
MKIKIYTEERTKRDEEETHQEEEGFVLFSLESEDPYFDLKKSMEKMEKSSPLVNRWRSNSEGIGSPVSK